MPLIARLALSLSAALALLAASPAAAEENYWLAKERFAVGVKYTGLTYHPDGGENEEPYPRSLDDRDFWVLQVGTQVDADYMVNKWFYLRTSQALYKDCSDVWAGFHNVGFRLNYDTPIGLSFRVGAGPTFLWRQTWLGKVKGYKRDSFFGKAVEGEKYQDAFIWHGGDVEVEYKAWEHASVVYSVIPGWPEVIHNSIGARYRF